MMEEYKNNSGPSLEKQGQGIIQINIGKSDITRCGS